jgi:hypothetical protein
VPKLIAAAERAAAGLRLRRHERQRQRAAKELRHQELVLKNLKKIRPGEQRIARSDLGPLRADPVFQKLCEEKQQ